MVKRISDKRSFEECIKSYDTVLIKFEADWCMPCKAMAPIVGEFSKNNPSVGVIAVDIEGEDIFDILGEYQVKSVPTFVVLKGGSIVNRAVGTLTRSELSLMVEV